MSDSSLLVEKGKRTGVWMGIARWVSIVGHPFAVLLLAVVVSAGRGGAARGIWLAGILAAGLIPLWVFMWWRYKSGRWETIDASAKKDRRSMYGAAFLVLVAVGCYFQFVAHAAGLVRGCVMIGLFMVVAVAVNRWVKVSGHVAMAVFVGVGLLQVSPVVGWVLLGCVPVLGWSRVALGRHTVVEVVVGAVLGLVGGGMMWV